MISKDKYKAFGSNESFKNGEWSQFYLVYIKLILKPDKYPKLCTSDRSTSLIGMNTKLLTIY